MRDSLTPVIQTNLDLHFGRLAPLTAPTDSQQQRIDAAAALFGSIAKSILDTTEDTAIDPSVQRYIFDKDKALPRWLLNRCLVLCENDRRQFEPTLQNLLDNNFNRRRFLDFISSELLYSCWLWSHEEDKRQCTLRSLNALRENGYCQVLNTQPYVAKLSDNVIVPPGRVDESFHWYQRSIGTVTLLDLSTEPVFEFTARLLEAKYKTTFILDVFKELFEAVRQPTGSERYGVLVMGEAPKAFALADYQSAVGAAPDSNPLALLCRLIDEFDKRANRQLPESRLRIGTEPPQNLTNRVAAMLWLRSTLAKVKTLQEKKNAPKRGLRVSERTVLLAALDQKSIVYFNLFTDPDDTAINPCHIRAVNDDSMVVQSPRGNRLNDAQPGQEVHGYFAVVRANTKSTYCDFRTVVESVSCTDPSHCLVELRIPAIFELTRRIHKRLPMDPSLVSLFEMSAPPPDADWTQFGNIEKWPAPFCIIPDGASHCIIKDISAGGLMLEIHQDAPAYGYFTEANRQYPLLVHLHLSHGTQTPLRLALRLEAKRIRDFPPLRKKYVGFQFVQAGEIRNERSVRFAPVSRDGLFCINDWIFYNGLAR
ncbi:MAG: pilus assembly protein PilZ [Acidobacteriota bacterium]